MKKGVLIYNKDIDRMEIRFDLNDYHDGLHCGRTLEVFIKNRWHQTRIEKAWITGYENNGWYLIDINTKDINGLIVRI